MKLKNVKFLIAILLILVFRSFSQTEFAHMSNIVFVNTSNVDLSSENFLVSYDGYEYMEWGNHIGQFDATLYEKNTNSTGNILKVSKLKFVENDISVEINELAVSIALKNGETLIMYLKMTLGDIYAVYISNSKMDRNDTLKKFVLINHYDEDVEIPRLYYSHLRPSNTTSFLFVGVLSAITGSDIANRRCSESGGYVVKDFDILIRNSKKSYVTSAKNFKAIDSIYVSENKILKKVKFPVTNDQYAIGVEVGNSGTPPGSISTRTERAIYYTDIRFQRKK
jgi:hypothetical protein